ncbi:MAG: hypothetical protein ACRD0S_01480 [Acidimicrobiales bacterium]
MDDAGPHSLGDAGYILVGLGVLWFQRAQVARRELARQLPDLPDVAELTEHLPAGIRDTLEAVATAVRNATAKPVF